MAITRIGDPAIADVRGVNFRNIIINGDQSIAQRGTSTSSITSTGYHTVDRFQTNISSMGTWTQSQSTTVPTGQGFAKSLKMDCTTADASPAAGDQVVIEQKVEGQNLQYLNFGNSSAKSLTLSFWVRSNKTGTYCASLFNNDQSKWFSKQYTISSADTWEKKTLTYAGDTSNAFNNDNGTSLRCRFWLGAGSTYTSGTITSTWTTESGNEGSLASGQVNLADSTSNEWYVTGIQLEAGQVASDFEFLPHDVNLNKCLRYFEKIADGSEDADGVIGSGGYVYQTNVLGVNYQWYPKRTTPSIYQSSGTNYFRFQRDGGTEDFNSIKIYIPNYLNGLIYSDDGFTGADDEKGWVQINSSSAYLGLTAEL